MLGFQTKRRKFDRKVDDPGKSTAVPVLDDLPISSSGQTNIKARPSSMSIPQMLSGTVVLQGPGAFRRACPTMPRMAAGGYGRLPCRNPNVWGKSYQSTQAAPRNSKTSSPLSPKRAKKPDEAISKSAEKTTHYRITLFRSAIGLTKPKRDTLASLGLKKRMRTVYHRHSPDMAGLILNVKELLKVENVTESEMKLGMKSTRRLIGDDRGYRLLYNARDP